MALQMKKVTKIPASEFWRGPRESKCQEAYELARDADHSPIAVSAQTPEELERFYKAVIQWRGRHKSLNLGIKKGRHSIYLWIEPIKEGAAPSD